MHSILQSFTAHVCDALTAQGITAFTHKMVAYKMIPCIMKAAAMTLVKQIVSVRNATVYAM